MNTTQSNRRRVVITGLGAVTPVGNSVAETWASLTAGRSGIGKLTRFDATGCTAQIAGEVKNYDPTKPIATPVHPRGAAGEPVLAPLTPNVAESGELKL